MKFLLVLAVFFSFTLCDSAQASCPRTRRNAARFCEDACNPARGCTNKNENCVCDGDCGYSCIPRGLRCRNPPRFRHGIATRTGGNSFNATVTYKCNSPYTLLGSVNRTCRGIGKWDGKKARCKILCSRPRTISFGDFEHVEGRRAGNKVYYRCFPGYERIGPASIVCGRDGQWNSNPPKCVVKTCKAPIIPADASLRGRTKNSYNFGQRIYFKCNRGFSPVGLAVWQCERNGWAKSGFRCLAKSCGHPATPQNGGLRGRVFTFRAKVFYVCNYGYDLKGDRYRVCHANQQWGGRLPSCVPKDCGRLPAPANGRKSFEDRTTFGGTVRFQCNGHLGYELKGSQQRTCEGNGQWSGAQTTCQLISCGDPGIVRYGRQIASNANFYGSTVRFICNRGYKLVGDNSIICQKSKTWSGVPPKCYASCPSPPRVTGRIVRGNDFSHGQSISFSCDRDYVMLGRRTIRCSNGQWSDRFPDCNAPCRNPGSPTNGYMGRRATPYLHGRKLTFYCKRGYRLFGKRQISCNDGTWSNFQMPRCIPVCNDPGYIRNGRRQGNDFLDGKIVLFICNRDYDLFGSRSIRCNKGRWSSSSPSCKRRCTNPGRIRNGKKVGTDYKHNSNVVYSCNRNYVLEGVANLRCNNGRWDGRPPRCQEPCAAPAKQQGRKVLGADYRHGKTLKFTCEFGYILMGKKQIRCNAGNWTHPHPNCKDCNQPLGMEDSRIPNNKITASGYFSNAYPHLARLHGNWVWCTKKGDRKAYLQINLGTLHRITAIAAQGSYIHWIDLRPFRVWYKRGQQFVAYKEGRQTKAKVFPGGGKKSVRKYKFKKVIETTTVRIYPKITGKEVACLRIELYGCKLA